MNTTEVDVNLYPVSE